MGSADWNQAGWPWLSHTWFQQQVNKVNLLVYSGITHISEDLTKISRLTQLCSIRSLSTIRWVHTYSYGNWQGFEREEKLMGLFEAKTQNWLLAHLLHSFGQIKFYAAQVWERNRYDLLMDKLHSHIVQVYIEWIVPTPSSICWRSNPWWEITGFKWGHEGWAPVKGWVPF